MRDFFASAACRNGHHCRTCRDYTAGRSFRTAIGARFRLPDPDFCCPYGRSWNVAGPFAAIDMPLATPKTPADPEAEREYAEEISATCARCPRRGTCDLGQLARRRPCEASGRLQAGATCDAGAVTPWVTWLANYYRA